MVQPVLPSLAETQLIAAVPCRRCSYDLRGLALDGRCPECGLEIWLSVQHVVDPAASRLPKLRDPVGVGAALVWLVSCALGSTLLLAVHAIFVGLGTHLQLGGVRMPNAFLAGVGLLPLAALWSVYKFSPPRSSESDVAVRADLRVLALALAGWAGAGLLLWLQARMMPEGSLIPGVPDFAISTSAIHIAIALSALTGLRSLQGVLATIGQRSRAYRRASGGRQGTQPMMAACAGVAGGSLLRIAGLIWPPVDLLHFVGTAAVWACVIMLLIGLGYLQVNAIWIAQALRKPPPTLESLVRRIPGTANATD